MTAYHGFWSTLAVYFLGWATCAVIIHTWMQMRKEALK